MTQEERLEYLIGFLLKEEARYQGIEIPRTVEDQRRLCRSLMNVRPPRPISDDFIRVQDEYLKEELRRKGTTKIRDLISAEPGIYLWKGDITTLEADVIVNAANSQMLGCFVPCHGCIDNAIHSAAGVQLRLECAHIMERQGREEAVGTAKITGAYNLPCRFILHTVGPIVYGALTREDCAALASCYRSCLELADSYGLCNVAFCCISTGEFHFPGEKAAETAVDTVRQYQRDSKTGIEVIFNVFKDEDYEIYRRLLGTDRTAGEAYLGG